MSKQETESIMLTPEEINQLSKVLAETLAKQITENPEAIQSVFAVSVSGRTIIREEEITHVVRLDLIASSTAGVLDPLGQLQDWFISAFNSVSSWIISSLQTFITENVLPLFDSLYSSIATFINTYVIPLFDTLYSNITTYIEDILMPAINALPTTITDFLNTNVLPAINGVISSLTTTITNLLNNAISSITDFVNTAIATIPDLISNVIAGIGDTINSVFASLSSAIDSLLATLSSAIEGAISTITSTINSITSTILDSISGIINTLSNIINSVTSSILDAINTIPSLISSISQSILGAISGIVTTLTDVFSSISQTIMNAITASIQTLMDVFNSVSQSIMGAISGIVTTITDVLSSVSQTIIDVVSSSIQTLSDIFSSIAETITSAISGITETLSNLLSSVASSIIETITNIGQTLGATISSFIETITSAISGITSAILDALNSAIQSISSVISGIAETITSTLSSVASSIIDAVSSSISAISETIGNISQMITSGFTTLGENITTLFNIVVTSFQDMANMVSTGFQAISTTFMGFVNAILKLPEMLATYFQNIGTWIWEALPEWLRTTLENIGKFFTEDLLKFFTETLPQSIGALVSNPLEWIQGNVVQPILSGLEWIWNAIRGVFDWLLGALKGVAEALWKTILGFGQAITSATLTSFTHAIEFSNKIVPVFQKPILESALKVYDAIMTAIQSKIEEAIQRITEGKPKAGLSEAGLIFGAMLSTQFSFRMVSRTLLWLGEQLDFDIFPNIAIKIFSAGGEKTIRIPLKFGAVLKHIGAEFKEYSDELMRGFMYGMAIWLTQPFVRALNSISRNLLPIEMPTLNDILEATRRSMSHEKFGEMLTEAKKWLSLYGYSDYAIDLYFKKAEEYSIEVTDRFGTPRKIPLALVYNLPSASDVATMMVRDLFASIKDFQKLYMARGMTPDIGALYYFLRFRYPPPERLWEFTSRGISGLLWATIPDAERREIAKELEPLGALMPTSPASLNFKADTLFSAFKTYMKWHDYFRGSWIKGFTSDNLIYIDTLADIPTKIDQRWMVKWGLYEFLKDKGVTMKSPIQEFVNKVVEATPTSPIQMDLTNFSRTLQATGMHPYWIPITAVAEAMNALSEERTLMRTGVMNLFKEGFIKTETFESVLAGAFVTSFKVAYFDINTYTWKQGYINLPVMFLPAERKLISLRAQMDRALDILREIQRDISTAYQNAIIKDYNEYKEKLTQVISRINEVMPEQIQLSFVEEYYQRYVEALNIYREVYTIRRIRSWAMRWLGWIMYRVATGLVTEQELTNLVNTIKQYAKLTKTEENFFYAVLNAMRGIAVKDYAPTPTQLATLSEYLVVPDNLIEKCFEVKMIPTEWRPIWRQYIKIRPVADDIKSLLTTYRRALIYVTLSPELEKEILSYAQKINFTDEELKILQLRAYLEELIRNSREYLPTPTMLATLSEYLTLPSDLIEEVLKERRVPEAWRNIWLTYVRVRPIKSDAKSLLSTYVRAFRYGAVSRDQLDNFIKALKNYGFTDIEIQFITERVNLEEQILEAKEYLPTPSMLATMSEYIAISDDLIKKVFIARRIPQEWQPIWYQYIKIRPIADDVRSLLSTYRRALLYVTIPDEIKKQVENLAKAIGFTQQEMEIMNLRVLLEEMISNSREYIPTPYMLATLCEYIPEARQFFDEVMQARRVPERWQPLWAKYIDIRPLVNDIRTYLSRAENLYVRFMIKKEDFEKILNEVADFLGYTHKEVEFLMKVTEFERARNAWTELIGTVQRLVSLSEYSPTATKYALGKLYAMIDALPVSDEEKRELKQMWEEYIRNRPVKSEARTYITQLINLFVDGLISETDFKRELQAMKKWGFSDYEIMFYEAQAALRKARKLRIPIAYPTEGEGQGA